MRAPDRVRRSEIDNRSASVAIERSVVARLALNAITHMTGAALADPLRGSDRGVALSQVWAEHGQQGGAVVGGDMRALAARTGQTVAGRLSATSPIDAGRIERALADFARAVQTTTTALPHLNAPSLVEPIVKVVTSGLVREDGRRITQGDAVEQFVRIVEGATDSLTTTEPRRA